MEETGRAGQDGKPTTAVLYSDMSTSSMLTDDSICNLKQGECRQLN